MMQAICGPVRTVRDATAPPGAVRVAVEELARMARTRHLAPPDVGLQHVLVVGGTGPGWEDFSDDAWRHRVRSFSAALAELGVPWLTLRPVEERLPETDEHRFEDRLAAALNGDVTDAGVVCRPVIGGPNGGVTVLVSPHADGRERFASAVDTLRREGVKPDQVDEGTLVGALLAPSGVEPDLVVILGPPTTLPPSLVWELAYAELVFLDLAWDVLDAGHLQAAVDDFGRRDRRFGGVDS
jgi:undecaprenyl diphosphate synthase